VPSCKSYPHWIHCAAAQSFLYQQFESSLLCYSAERVVVMHNRLAIVFVPTVEEMGKNDTTDALDCDH
jgi:hypothetical protein